LEIFLSVLAVTAKVNKKNLVKLVSLSITEFISKDFDSVSIKILLQAIFFGAAGKASSFKMNRF
jgi:hypothetical protein